MRVLLIGGSGFIGRKVVERLQQRGHHVIIFHRGESDPPDDDKIEDVTVITGNRLEIDQYTDEIKAAKPDAAIDFLPWADDDTKRVIKALNGHVERVVHLSSGDVYQAWGNFLTGRYGEPVPLSEESPLREELYPYTGTRPGMESYDKVLAERAIFQAHYERGYPGTILRLPMVYGPGDRHHRTWPYIKRMLDGRPVILLSACHATWLWQRGYVDNIAFAIVLAAERASSIGQVYNVGSPQTLCVAAWVDAISEVMAWQGVVRLLPASRLPNHLQTGYGYQQHIIYDTTKIRRELGYYELVDAGTALRRTVEWQCANPPDDSNDSVIFDYDREDAALREWLQR